MSLLSPSPTNTPGFSDRSEQIVSRGVASAFEAGKCRFPHTPARSELSTRRVGGGRVAAVRPGGRPRGGGAAARGACAVWRVALRGACAQARPALCAGASALALFSAAGRQRMRTNRGGGGEGRREGERRLARTHAQLGGSGAGNVCVGGLCPGAAERGGATEHAQAGGGPRGSPIGGAGRVRAVPATPRLRRAARPVPVATRRAPAELRALSREGVRQASVGAAGRRARPGGAWGRGSLCGGRPGPAEAGVPAAIS